MALVAVWALADGAKRESLSLIWYVQRQTLFSRTPTPRTAGHLQAYYLLFLGFGIYPKSHPHAILAWLFSSFRNSHKSTIKYAPEAAVINHNTFEMVQTYGVANDTIGEPINHIPGDGEDSALLGGDSAVKHIGRADGHASIVSCVSNLSNTIIGSGMYCQLWN
jgi:hypothetical protein